MKEKEQIRAYLRGTLSAADRELFEKTLATDPELAEQLALERTEMAAAELLIAGETREMFRSWSSDQNAAPTPQWRRWIWVFGACACVLAVAFWYVQRKTPPAVPVTPAMPSTPAPERETPAQVPVAAAPERQPAPANNFLALARQQLAEPLMPNLRSPGADTASGFLVRAQRAYAAGKYRETLDLLAQTDSSRQQSADFLAAHAYFHLQQFGAAERQFAKLVTAQSRQYRYQAEWGVLMCRLATCPKTADGFRLQLNAILANPQHPYYPQAVKLQQALKK